MPDDARKIRKVISFSEAEWKAVEDFRFEHRIKTEAEAARELIAAGLKAKKKD